ncbi:MAG TPA: DUF6519 domain-containing protein [Myxococcales bacterium]
MPGDFSRNTFNENRHYSGVLMQQGRVQLDADWNEQLAIQQHRTAAEARDVIGACGTPKGEDGFHVTVTPRGRDLFVAPGRYYAGGLLCELESSEMQVSFPPGTTDRVAVPSLELDGRDLAPGQWVRISAEQAPAQPFQIVSVDAAALALTLDGEVSAFQGAGVASLQRAVTYGTQPDYADGNLTDESTGPLALADGTYLVYLEAWQREVNALEDRHIRETALDGPDTTERLETVWQVKLLPVTPQGSPPGGGCEESYPEWDRLLASDTGALNARTILPQRLDNPCLLPPKAGYQRLENQLYRVEIFRGGSRPDEATYVWSRDNATVETAILDVDGERLTVADLGKDAVLGFAAQQWVEIVSREGELQGGPRFLAQIVEPPDPDLKAVRLSASAEAYANRKGLRLRRWDVTGPEVTPQGLPIKPSWLELESGIEVQFLDGTYSAGNHWLIPARTATGEIEWPPFEVPNTRPTPQPPGGVARQRCRLALLDVRDGAYRLEDCRRRFPSLTALAADDVGYTSRCDDLAEARTVQEALDDLCQQRNLRFHNKHLHGWGIVCGLQVHCGPDDPDGGPRRHVTVMHGYAVDADGNDVLVNEDTILDVVDMLRRPDGTGPADAEYCLILDPRAKGSFRFVPYDSSWNDFRSMLDDTLLMDLYQDCILPLGYFYSSQFTEGSGSSELVGPAAQRLIALGNLLAGQYITGEPGAYVFLSPEEDLLLRDLYRSLRGLLQSKTFCAMFDGARPFPAYPFGDFQTHTIFGDGFRRRLRVDPTGRRAYAIGTDASIAVHDLAARKMIALLQFPGGSGAVVRDVAFSPKGDQVFVIAVLNGTDTGFATVTVDANQQHAWGPMIVVCGLVFSTLGTYEKAANSPPALCAVATAAPTGKGTGLYLFDPANISPTPTPAYLFNAFGQLAIDHASKRAYATAWADGNSSSFTQIATLDLDQPPTSPTTPPLISVVTHDFGNVTGGNDSDDLLFVPASDLPGLAVGSGLLYLTASTATQSKELLELSFPAGGPKLTGSADTAEGSTAVRLAYDAMTRFLVLTSEDGYRLKLFKPNGKALENFAYPVQMQPSGIAYDGKSGTVYVLNYLSKTITTIPGDRLDPNKTAFPFQDLLDYRSGVIDAFLDLAGGGLQYLKDCLCDHLLVKCPERDEDDDLFLGCVTIRDGAVYKVCNFSKRKYVKSFPTVGYWLSLVPLLPLLKLAVEKLCCAALPDIFGKKSAPQPSATFRANPATASYTTSVRANTLEQGITLFQMRNFNDLIAAAGKRVIGGQAAARDFLAARTTPSRSSAPPPIAANDVVGSTVEGAMQRLAGAKIQVAAVLPYDPASIAQNVGRVALSPDKLQPGTSVSLVADQRGMVRFSVPASPEVAQLSTQVQQTKDGVSGLRTSVQDIAGATQQMKARLDAAQTAVTAAQMLGNEIAGLKAQIVDLQSRSDKALAVRDQQIRDLTAALQTHAKTVEDLRAQVRVTKGPGGGG